MNIPSSGDIVVSVGYEVVDMVRWEDIPKALQGNMKTRTAPFEHTPWVEAPKLTDARVAIITTAAIHR
ncbi:MAG: hypothetical protein VX484_00980, partial [Chloroflexota bacterium]|nr:hypothetical protein [Chloroflexota bacterium]